MGTWSGLDLPAESGGRSQIQATDDSDNDAAHEMGPDWDTGRTIDDCEV